MMTSVVTICLIHHFFDWIDGLIRISRSTEQQNDGTLEQQKQDGETAEGSKTVECRLREGEIVNGDEIWEKGPYDTSGKVFIK